MKTRIYLVKKNPDQIGNKIEWIQMSGEEFTAFRRSAEGRGRFFIHLTDEAFDDGTEILIEATQDEYRKWKAGQDHHYYLQKQARRYDTLSLDAQVTDGTALVDSIASDDASVEDFVMDKLQKEQLNAAVELLSEKERGVIRIMFYGDVQLTEEEAAQQLGMSKSALHRWKVKIFGEIRKNMRTKS